MKKFTYTITDSLGIHARPAGLLVKEAARFDCAVTLTKGDKSADAKKLFAVMGLGAKCGDTLTVTCDGADEDAASPAMQSFLAAHL